MKSVAIIGGGITGLCAAFRLQQLGIPATVYEAKARVGGVIQTFEENGFLVESGPNSILETSPRLQELVRDLRLQDDRIYSDPAAEKRYIVRGKRPVELPSSPAAFAFTKLFSLRAKMNLLAEPFRRRAQSEVEESLGAFVRRRLGQEFLDYAINPFVAGVYAGDPDRLSVKHAFPKLHALEQRYGSLILGQVLGARARRKRAEISKANAKKFSFQHGLQTLPERLRFQLGSAIRLDAPVSRVERRAGSWLVASRLAGELEHSAVLFAGAARHLAELQWIATSPVNLSLFKEIYYPPVASLALGFRREDVRHPLDGFGMLIPACEKFRILGGLFSSSLFPNRAPAGHVLLTTFLGGARDPSLAGGGLEEMIEMAFEDLRQILGIERPPVFAHRSVFPQAIPQYEVGYGRFRDAMDNIEQGAPGFFIAGHFREGISLSDSILSGLNAAERIHRQVIQTEAAPVKTSEPFVIVPRT